jgi:hypothetical protein
MTIDGLPTTVKPEDTDLTKARDGQMFSVVVAPSGWNWGGLLEGIKGATGLPAYGTKSRDAILRASIMLDPMWRSAVATAVQKYVAMGYTVDDTSGSPRRLAYAQEIIRSYDGGNYSRGLTKGLQDYLLTNWGQVAYIDRPKAGSRVQGLYHLDSLRCYPYPHREYPMVYYSPIRGAVLLRSENIIHVSAMTSPDPVAYNLGLCAADAIWSDLLLMVAKQIYLREKISGTRNLAIHFIVGVAPQTLKDALNTSDEAREQRGFVLYKGSTIIPMLGAAGGPEPQVITIPLAEIPDGFDAEEINRDFYLRAANVVGIPVQELQPLSGQGLGTGVQTQVLDDAAKGKGLAAYVKEWSDQVSWKALPDTATYKIAAEDLRDQKLRAEVSEIRARTRAARIESGEISVQMARQLAFDDGDLPQEMLGAADATAGGQLTDAQKPLVESDLPPMLPAPQAPPVATKAARVRRFSPDAVADVEGAALALLQEIRGAA